MSEKPLPGTEDEWRERLTAEQFEVCRNKGTEHPFSGKFYSCTDPGQYRCVCCGNILFDSGTKYDSGSGWPSFYAPVTEDAVKTDVDNSLGRQRIEVMCSVCEAHLGHVFEDGPEPTGLRYCINSIALTLDSGDNPPRE
jgi:peptide-methionine (R)-S-oxide reductase